ncbi:MAG: chromosome segregation protein SMC [Oscillospiraceae bacterium]|nr:chromosome segregation protein SMC [Oscillospiraceae bacterium]
MRFKTLEIQGFKSFADKTILTFDSRTTAVVGSNGNGKSNISDALRWVMGEQGAKTLRGDKMEDVIFYGTQTRKPMGFAKVALTIENSDRRIAIDSDEVVITRKLYRTGESEYLINGERSRLKDVNTLFMGTGLGRDGYSIIGQGRIDEVVNSKAAGRRELFEEAAGVSKFLHQKATAERELARTEDNLLRLLDIEMGLQERIPILERQAEKANKAFALKEEERALGVALSVRELERLSKESEEADNAVLQNLGECEHFEREIETLEEEAERIGDSKRETTALTERVRRKGEDDKDSIAETSQEIAVARSEIQHNEGRVSSIRTQIADSEKSEGEIGGQIERLEDEIVTVKREIDEIDKNAAAKTDSLKELESRNAELDEEHRDITSEIGELYTAKQAAQIYISRAEESVNELKAQLEQSERLAADHEGEKAELQSKIDGLRKSLEELSVEKDETVNKLSGYSRLYESKATKRDELREQLEQLKQEEHRKKTRFDVLSGIEQSMDGYYSSVKSVMQAAKSGRFGNGAVLGTVADVITVPREYAVAVEIALGSALQNVIVANESNAKRCIAFLKESNAGRATFLPLTSVSGKVLEGFADLDVQDGFVGYGHEIVEYDPRYVGIIKSLLGRTAFAEDIDSATLIAKKYGYKFKIVTLDGQVINAGGSFTGGSIKKSEGIISRKREIEELRKQLQLLVDEIEPAKIRYSGLAAETAKMKLECEGMNEELSRFALEETRLTSELGGGEALLSSLSEQFANLEENLVRCKARLAEEQSVIETNAAEHERIAAELQHKEQVAVKTGERLADLIERRREIVEAVSDANLQKLTRNKDIESLLLQIEGLNSARLKSGESRDVLLNEIDSLCEKNIHLEELINEKSEGIEQINAKLAANKEEIAELVRQIEEFEKRASQIHAEIKEKIENKQKFSNAHAAAIERKQGLVAKSEEIKANLFDNYELTPSEAVEFCEKSDGVSEIKDMREARSKLNEIRRKLAELGNVNYAAINEFVEVSERYKELSVQLKDVRGAKSELEKLIEELTFDIRSRFLASFTDISAHFSRIFTEIFGGGTARLELTDPDDVMSSGIEIYAAPPGKLIKSLIALSGGEKALVAITLYFAILLHRPTPFCMLDEVDAALDEVNVAKYINYLSRYSDTTQLMMITHRRPTIEGCDVLYGVFMQEKGVSRLLKQEIRT